MTSVQSNRGSAAVPAVAPRVWLNGELVPAERAAISVYDHGLLYGDGVFEGIRAYNGRVFKLATHLRRLFASADAIRLTIPFTADQLDAAIRATLAANNRINSYIRLCVTRGVGTLGLNPFTCKTPSVFIITDDIALYPREFYERGMAVITSTVLRNHPAALSPRIKSMNYLNNILAKVQALDAGVMEAVMFNHEGNVAECTGDNVFVVRQREGRPVVTTPPIDAGALEGVTRNVVLRLARDAGLDAVEADIRREDLYAADEMFLTGTAAEIIPVTKVDDHVIGKGVAGPVTKRLSEAFHQLVAHNAPED